MRYTPAFRLWAALLGVLFAINFAEPLRMSGMDMSGMGMSGMNMPGMDLRGTHAPADTSGARVVATAVHTTPHDAAHNDSADVAHCADITSAAPADSQHEQHRSAPSNTDNDCKQHECCASALVHASLSAVATLSWLPEHVISQDTPETGDCVVDTEGQLKLPFANGPPAAVIV